MDERRPHGQSDTATGSEENTEAVDAAGAGEPVAPSAPIESAEATRGVDPDLSTEGDE